MFFIEYESTITIPLHVNKKTQNRWTKQSIAPPEQPRRTYRLVNIKHREFLNAQYDWPTKSFINSILQKLCIIINERKKPFTLKLQSMCVNFLITWNSSTTRKRWNKSFHAKWIFYWNEEQLQTNFVHYSSIPYSCTIHDFSSHMILFDREKRREENDEANFKEEKLIQTHTKLTACFLNYNSKNVADNRRMY